MVAAKEKLGLLLVALDDDLGGLHVLVQDVGHVVAGGETVGACATVEGASGVATGVAAGVTAWVTAWIAAGVAAGVGRGVVDRVWVIGDHGVVAGPNGEDQLGGVVGVLDVGFEGVGRGQDGGQGEEGGLEMHCFEREREKRAIWVCGCGCGTFGLFGLAFRALDHGSFIVVFCSRWAT